MKSKHHTHYTLRARIWNFFHTGWVSSFLRWKDEFFEQNWGIIQLFLTLWLVLGAYFIGFWFDNH